MAIVPDSEIDDPVTSLCDPESPPSAMPVTPDIEPDASESSLTSITAPLDDDSVPPLTTSTLPPVPTWLLPAEMMIELLSSEDELGPPTKVTPPLAVLDSPVVMLCVPDVPVTLLPLAMTTLPLPTPLWSDDITTLPLDPEPLPPDFILRLPPAEEAPLLAAELPATSDMLPPCPAPLAAPPAILIEPADADAHRGARWRAGDERRRCAERRGARRPA